jgi:hypothetical protein
MWPLEAPARIVAIAATGAVHQAAPQLDSLMLFGFLTAFLTLVFCLNRHQSKATMAALAVCLAATAAYGFLQGAWLLGVIQIVWSAMALRQLFKPASDRAASQRPRQQLNDVMPSSLENESRISRMFGAM